MNVFDWTIIGTIIGAYSLVLDDIPENSIAYGIPARVMKKNEGTVE